jgi:hypothetical protein
MDYIGRPRNAAERTLARAIEIPSVGEYHARCYYESSAPYWKRPGWSDLSQETRDEWITRTIAEMREYAETYRPPPDDDPDGGEPMPVLRIA